QAECGGRALGTADCGTRGPLFPGAQERASLWRRILRRDWANAWLGLTVELRSCREIAFEGGWLLMPSEWLERLDPRSISILIYFLLILYLLRPNVLQGQSGRVILLLRWCLVLNATGELIIKFGDLMLPLSATASLLVGRGLTTTGFFFAYMSLSEMARTPAPRWLRFALLCPGAAAGLGLSTLWLNGAISPASLSELLEIVRSSMVLFEGGLFALFIPLFYRLTKRETALLGRTRFGLFLLAV